MSRYLDTTRLRQVIADGHTLDKNTVLDLLSRLERYQDADLQQLAKDNQPETLIGGTLINPDCRDGKHQSCSNTGWNTATEDLDHCPCPCHQGQPEVPGKPQ